MKTSDQVSQEKLRGGFYTPPGLVQVCLERVSALVGGRRALSVLEPSAGDGAFIRGLAGNGLSSQICAVTAIEVVAEEAAKCRARAPAVDFRLDVLTGSALDARNWRDARFDVAVGNPPFVRFQFVTPDDVAASDVLAKHLKLSFAGVSNLWLPIFLAALASLKDGGAFAFVVPAEFFTGISANVARQWLIGHVGQLRVDLFGVGSFPRVMQEVVVVSGVIDHPSPANKARLQLREHNPHAGTRLWEHDLSPAMSTWTAYLLRPEQLKVLEDVRALPGVRRVSELARFEVATVTGANEFFTVNRQTLDDYGLNPWALPLLPRVRHAPGLRFGADDYAALRDGGAKAYLLSFASDRPEPGGYPARSYLQLGEKDGLPDRYKCRIRSPWYRVPVVPAGRIMLSKRSHRYPRAILNCAGAYTTDTIYRGRMLPAAKRRPSDLVASFHSSLTLLTAEIEGRSFGGGVLELVPSEVGRLLVAVPRGLGEELERLDCLARSGSSGDQALIAETDRLLAKHVAGLDNSVLEQLQQARLLLLSRRMDRNGAP